MERLITDFKDLTEPQSSFLSRVEQDEKFTDIFFHTGGTLLKALGIVPRISNDLDFFTFSHVDDHDFWAGHSHARELLEDVFEPGSIIPADKGFLHRESNMVIDIIADGSPNISEFEPFGNLRTASLQDLAAHKASALCSRDELKDYIDIAFLTKDQGWLLEDLARIAEQKFRIGTISEEKLLTELLAKRDAFSISPEIFLRAPEENIATVTTQINYLIDNTSL